MLEAFAAAERGVTVTRGLWATVGDEFQAVYPDIPSALQVTTVAALLLPAGVEVRCGIGSGEAVEIGEGVADGSAWWRAREAINEAHRREDAGAHSLRTWHVGDVGHDGDMISAFLQLRDHVVGRMKARERRIAAAMLQGRTQAHIAADESITQAAVSQNAHRSGAAPLRAALATVQRSR